MMKQPQYQPLAVWEQAVVLLAVNSGLFDDVAVGDALALERGMREHLKVKHADLIGRLESTKDLSKEDEAALLQALRAFRQAGH